MVFLRQCTDFLLEEDIRVRGLKGKASLIHSVDAVVIESIVYIHNNLCHFSLLAVDTAILARNFVLTRLLRSLVCLIIECVSSFELEKPSR